MSSLVVRCSFVTTIRSLVASLWIAVALATPAGAVPLTFMVNGPADVPDIDPGNGVCETAAGNHVCTLRASIQEANKHPGADTILLQPNATYTLTRPASSQNENEALDGDLDITDAVRIVGAGPKSTVIDGNGAVTGDRVLQLLVPNFNDPQREKVEVDISGVTLQNGRAPNLAGGIFNASDKLKLTDCAVIGNRADGLNDWGGGIFNAGPATFVRTTISGNMTGNHNAYGGGIFNQSSLTIIDSTISGNQTFQGPSSPGIGGGIFNAGGPLVIKNSTISGNTAYDGGGIYNGSSALMINSTISGNFSNRNGGGIYAKNGTTRLFNVTIALNLANADDSGSGLGGGVAVDGTGGGTLSFINSIIALNEVDVPMEPFPLLDLDDCQGTITSQGNNIMYKIDPDHCTVNGAVAIEDPGIGNLADNGGATRTHALHEGSPAIDGGNPAGCTDDLGGFITRDQRGISRPKDGNADASAICDIGAYERGKPKKPALRKPAGGATAVSTRPRLRWKPTPGTKNYSVQINEGSPTGASVLNRRTGKTRLKTPPLHEGTTYFWKVRACNDIGCGKRARHSFTVAP